MLERAPSGKTGSQKQVDWLMRFNEVSLEIGRKRLIHNLNFELAAERRTVVLGPNGAGKSLFLRLVSGLLDASQGQIVFNPQNDPRKGPAGLVLVFQNPILLRRSVYQNMAFVGWQNGLAKAELDHRIMLALQQARLQEKAHLPARRLSGGEQQRLALARALLAGPTVLLLDEPTASLDPASTHIVENMINRANSDGTKIILVTHDIKQAKRMADEILFIHDGRILVQNEAAAFFADPACEEAQCYLDGRIPPGQAITNNT